MKKIKNNTKKHIFIKIMLGILILLLIIFTIFFINKLLLDFNNKKISSAIDKLEKEKINYVFIEINPSLVLTIKENKVNDVACLNDDCMSIYNEIDVKGKSIDDSIDNLYNLSKEKGFAVSNGVIVKSTDELKIADKDHVKVEYINDTTKNDLLSNVMNNENIKDNSNDDYYTKLWKELKKDSEYDKVYTCKMNNNELECYFIMSAIDHSYNKDSDYNFDSEDAYNKFLSLFQSLSSKVVDTLDKFGIEKQGNSVYINNIKFSYVPLFTLNDTSYKNVLRGEKIETFSSEFCEKGLVEYDENGKCQINDGFYLIPLETLNLLNLNASLENMIVHEFRLKENIMKQYEALKMIGEW